MNTSTELLMQAELKAQGCTSLGQLTRRVSQLYDLETAKAGLKTTQYSLLSHILKLGPLRPSELALKMKFIPSTLTRNLKPLIDTGWVSLSAGSDGRSRTVASHRPYRGQADRSAAALESRAGKPEPALGRGCWRCMHSSMNL